MKKGGSKFAVLGAALILAVFGFLPAAGASNVQNFIDQVYEGSTFHGFLQQGISVNTEDPGETPDNDSGYISMARSTLYLDYNLDLPWGRFTVISRYDLEYETEYLDRLQELSNQFDIVPPVGMAKIDIMDEIEGFEFREYYGDFQFWDRFFLRVGKQQVVWGKTDFFSGLDIVHGYDYRWRNFLEAENEQRRKPLFLFNLETQVPEAEGTLQLLFRPGWDRPEDIGNTFDLYGGRWANAPNKGNNFLHYEVTPYNYDHPEGEYDDPTYGIRWSGRLGPVEYSLNYLNSFYQDPVYNPSPLIEALIGAERYKVPGKGVLGELFYKKVDIAGLTANYWIPGIDIVVRGEFSYTWDAPFNYGSVEKFGEFAGFAGVKEKDIVRSMIAFDRDVDFVKWLFGAYRPGFFNMQLFDTWVQSHDDAEELVYLVGFGKPREEHETILTAILAWNYDLDRINPTIAWGTDLTNGGGFFIPSIKFAYGDHWRFVVEYDMFYGGHDEFNGQRALGSPGRVDFIRNAGLFDYFSGNDQLYFRLTYQF